MSQNDMVLEYLKGHDGITSKEASIKLSCTRLAARIDVLRKRGHEITDEWDYSLNQFGNKVRFKRYRLVKE